MIVTLANALVLFVPILVGTGNTALWFTWLDAPDGGLAFAATFHIIAFFLVAAYFTKPDFGPSFPALIRNRFGADAATIVIKAFQAHPTRWGLTAREFRPA